MTNSMYDTERFKYIYIFIDVTLKRRLKPTYNYQLGDSHLHNSLSHTIAVSRTGFEILLDFIRDYEEETGCMGETFCNMCDGMLQLYCSNLLFIAVKSAKINLKNTLIYKLII